MRTTITLDPDVVELVERAMRERRLSFKEAVNQALRHGLRPPGAAVAIRTLSLGGPKPGVDLHHANRLVADIEDDELARKLEMRK